MLSRAARSGREWRRRGADVPVGVDDEIIVAVDVAIVIEITVEEGEDAAGLVEMAVDLEVVVAVERAVEVGIAAPGVHDHDVAAGERDAAEGSADAIELDGGADGEGGHDAGGDGIGLAGDDADA